VFKSDLVKAMDDEDDDADADDDVGDDDDDDLMRKLKRTHGHALHLHMHRIRDQCKLADRTVPQNQQFLLPKIWGEGRRGVSGGAEPSVAGRHVLNAGEALWCVPCKRCAAFYLHLLLTSTTPRSKHQVGGRTVSNSNLSASRDRHSSGNGETPSPPARAVVPPREPGKASGWWW
jgi:hypothetical protein